MLCFADDPAAADVVLAGGFAQYQHFITDTWTYHAGQWTNVTATAGPVPLGGGLCAYDPTDGYLLLFGGNPGANYTGVGTSYTWALKDGVWTNLSGGAGSAPAPTSGAGYLCADPVVGGMLLLEDPVPPYNGSALTWKFAGGVWTNLTASAGTPPPLSSGGSIAYDAASSEVVQFGGAGYVLGPNNSVVWQAGTWVFNGTRWANLTGTTPPLRWFEDLTYDPTLEGLLMFGGNLLGAPTFNDSWLFSNNSWTNVTSDFSVPLPPTVGPDVMVDDSTDGYLLLVTEDYANETWVLGNPPPFARQILPSGPIEAREPYVLSTTIVSNDRPVSANATSVPPGCVISAATTWNCTSPSAGTFPFDVVVTDANDRSTGVRANVTIGPSIGVGSFSATPTAVHLGGSVAFQLDLTGGIGSVTVNYSGLPSGCVAGNVTSFRCTLAVQGASKVQAKVVDSIGHAAFANLTVGAWALPRLASVTISPTLLEVGDTLALHANVTGGAPPVTLDYQGVPPGCAPAAGLNAMCAPSMVGTYNVTVNATDSLGATVLSAPQPIAVRPDLIGILLNASAERVSTGQTFTVVATVGGGIAPLSYEWANLPPGCQSTNATLVCSTNTSGQYSIDLAVSDADGHSALLAADVLVVAPPTSAPAPGLGYVLGGVAVVLIGATVIILIRRRRSSARPPDTDDSGSTPAD